ncbi:hypothetical protein M8J77_013932 [Diaphorina citri]|nr:hypothetical protein M8J77_013932 [Diaphorina citri]
MGVKQAKIYSQNPEVDVKAHTFPINPIFKACHKSGTYQYYDYWHSGSKDLREDTMDLKYFIITKRKDHHVK